MKARIYKSRVRPTLTYGAESRVDTTTTKRQHKDAEKKLLTTMIGRTRQYRITNVNNEKHDM